MKQKISVFDKAGDICKAMKQGILLTSGTLDNPNTMTIGWGTVGVEWGKPVFVAFVRESRYTHQLIDQTGEFTVNIPVGECDKSILGFCGSKSGRDVDKFAQLNLSAVAGNVVSAPGIRQLPLTLECKVLHRQLQPVSEDIDPSVDRYYPLDPDGKKDFHIMYFAEIVDSYIITD